MLKMYHTERDHQVARNALYQVSVNKDHQGCTTCAERIDRLYGWAAMLAKYGYQQMEGAREIVVFFPSGAKDLLKRFGELAMDHESSCPPMPYEE